MLTKGEYKNLTEWSEAVASELRDLYERDADARCRALAIEDILVNAGLTDRVRLAAALKVKRAAVRPGENVADETGEAPQPPEQADAPTTRGEYAQRFLDQLDRRTIEVAGVHGRMVLMTAIEAAVNNPELFPAPIVQGVDPAALRALPRRLIISGALSLCDSEHGDIVFWRDVQALIDALPAEPQPANPPECQGDSHQWVSYQMRYANAPGVHWRRICVACHADEWRAPRRRDEPEVDVVSWPRDRAAPEEPGKPEPTAGADAPAAPAAPDLQHDGTIRTWTSWSSDGPRTVSGTEYMPEHMPPAEPAAPADAPAAPVGCATGHHLWKLHVSGPRHAPFVDFSICVDCGFRQPGPPPYHDPRYAEVDLAQLPPVEASQHPADVLADLAERSGHEVDPEAMAAFRAACDKPVAGTPMCPPAGHDWIEFKGLDPSHPNGTIRICQRCGLRLDKEESTEVQEVSEEGLPVLHCSACGENDLAPKWLARLPGGGYCPLSLQTVRQQEMV